MRTRPARPAAGPTATARSPLATRALAAAAALTLTLALAPTTPAAAGTGAAAAVDLDALFIGAHPDDEAFTLSTLGQWNEDHDVRTGVVTVTRGEGGGNAVGPEEGPALGLLREAEERSAVGKAGIGEVFNLDDVDFYYTVSAPLTDQVWGGDTLEKVVRLVRTTRPEILLTMDPAPTPGNHGNHQEAARLAVEAFYAAADPKRFPEQISREGLRPFAPARLLTGGARGTSQPGPDCASTFRPTNPAQNVYGVWSGRPSPSRGKTWAAVERDAQRVYASQGWAGFPDVPTDPAQLTCDFFTQVDARVPFPEPGTPAAAAPTAILDGALTRPNGSAPLGTRLSLRTSTFDVRPGTPFTVEVTAQAPPREPLGRSSVTLRLPEGWKADPANANDAQATSPANTPDPQASTTDTPEAQANTTDTPDAQANTTDTPDAQASTTQTSGAPTSPDPTDPSRPDPSRPDPSRPDPSRPDPSRPDPSRPDSSRPDPSRPDPSRPDPSRPDSSISGSSHSTSTPASAGSPSPGSSRAVTAPGTIDLGKLSAGRSGTATFTVTPPSQAPLGRARIGAVLTTERGGGYTDRQVEVGRSVRAAQQPLPQVAQFEKWTGEVGVPQLRGLVTPVLTLPSGGTRQVGVVVTNVSDTPRSGTVRMDLPPGFTADRTEAPYTNLAAGASTTLPFTVTNADPTLKTSNEGGDYTYTLTTTAEDGTTTSRPALELVPATSVPQASAAPTVDGAESDGEYGGAALDISRLWEGTACSSAADCSGTAKLTWHDDTLYVLVHVRDDVLGTRLAASDCKRHWRTDSVEITLDPRGTSENTSTTFKTAVLPVTAEGPPCHLRDADNRQGPGEETAPGMRVASKVSTGAYTVELSIPMEVLPGAVDPAHLGLNILVYDSDTQDRTGQTRIGWSTWGGVQGDPYRWAWPPSPATSPHPTAPPPHRRRSSRTPPCPASTHRSPWNSRSASTSHPPAPPPHPPKPPTPSRPPPLATRSGSPSAPPPAARPTCSSETRRERQAAASSKSRPGAPPPSPSP
ncbi:sugar-binding protein [[Actinomadura] parvosata]|uniref:sugar-binding protein n=1 Tax=[Actinomadura] parvosata TaxID=1955412 RepID=UPI001E4306CB|nr:sugar-binding protein [Nonomuraea sp. ATCC 55076]